MSLEAAETFLNNVDAGVVAADVAPEENSDGEAVETLGVKKTEKPAEAPPPTELEKSKAEVEAEKIRLSETRRKIDDQHVAINRRVKAIEAREAKVIEREKENEVVSVVDMVSLLSKRRGCSVDEVWRELAEQIRNDGKPTETQLLKRQVETLTQQREREANEKKEAEATASEQAREAFEAEKQEWATAADSIIADEATKTKYPKLMSQPRMLIETAVIDITKRYIAETGKLPEHAELFAYLEGQLPEPAPVAEVRKPKPKVTIPSGADANAPAEVNENMSEHERLEAAARWLDSQE